MAKPKAPKKTVLEKLVDDKGFSGAEVEDFKELYSEYKSNVENLSTKLDKLTELDIDDLRAVAGEISALSDVEKALDTIAENIEQIKEIQEKITEFEEAVDNFEGSADAWLDKDNDGGYRADARTEMVEYAGTINDVKNELDGLGVYVETEY